MNERRHSPEPWQTTRPTKVVDADGEMVLIIPNGENERRIVACVNACMHLPTEFLEKATLGDLVPTDADPPQPQEGNSQ